MVVVGEEREGRGGDKNQRKGYVCRALWVWVWVAKDRA